MNPLPTLAQQALDHARRGDFDQALDAATKALVDQPDDFGLTLFLGLLYSRRTELDKAVMWFERALELEPADPIPRLELARTMIGLDRLNEAHRLLAAGDQTGPEWRRLTALLSLRRGQFADAAAEFDRVVRADPRDFESWGNLGVSLLAEGHAADAVSALGRSLGLRSDQPRFREKWIEAQIAAGSGEATVKSLTEAAQQDPHSAEVRVTLARLLTLLGRPEQSERWLDQALQIDPRYEPALVAVAQLLERQNRVGELEAIVDRLATLSPPAAELPLLNARLAFRRGEFDHALDLARELPPQLDGGDRAQLLGQILDRRGDSPEAFAAFGEMHAGLILAPEVIDDRARSFRDRLAAQTPLLTPGWVGTWQVSRPSGRREPAIVFSFPRSGTTILDTLLMGHAAVRVTEERPMIDTVARRIGGQERLAQLTSAEIDDLRASYFAIAESYVPDLGERLLVDKNPFATVEIPVVHRLFPNARLVFVERHPCDVVLSCFITRFEPNPATLNFTTLERAAQLYDRVMEYWARCREVLPLDVHTVRYETIVAETEAEMRGLLGFLGLDWSDRVLDHQATATERGIVNTASYAQISEPLYDRSIGRWQRYREQMAPVLPTLNKWARRMGYEI